MSPNQPLHPLRFPLTGSALIEASAGTGKTFTLALLYLRLILGHGGDQAFARPLLPPDILVVTFTKAATRELRERIRQRLVETALVFRSTGTDRPTADTYLLQLRDELLQAVPQEQQAQQLAEYALKLEVAAEWMDDAAISTIHAWCYRMLREHAFDSGSLFDEQLLDSETDLLQRAAEDYWRCFYLALDAPSLQEVLQHFGHPEALRQQVEKLLLHRQQLPVATEPPASLLARQLQQRSQQLIRLKQQLAEHLPQVAALFEQARQAKAYKAQSLNSRHISSTLGKLQDWINDPAQLRPDIDFAGSNSFQRLALLDTSIWTDTRQLPLDHPACKTLAALPEQLDQLPDTYPSLLCHAVHWIARRTDEFKRQQSALSHHDLLQRLDQALQGERGQQLAAAIRTQFPLALVDEFQDTDPLQYRIFNSIYRIHDPWPDTGFFMIGDPKQAIYAFRGADIHTYLAAKRDTGKRLFTLQQNFRSSPALIDAVNQLFLLGEQQSQGSFAFRRNGEDPIPFLPVQPGRLADRYLLVDGQPQAAQTAWLLPFTDEGKAATKEDYNAFISDCVASQLVHLLTLAQQGKALLVDEADNSQRPLAPQDIALLVNNRHEAEQLQAALRRRQLPSVYLSEQGSVYATDTALELLLLLRAVANPGNSQLLRQALATRLLGWPLSRLDQLNQDELAWQLQFDAFCRYQRIWQQQGVLAVVHTLISDFGLANRLLTRLSGERQLTDLLHLAELLQQAATALDGEQALLRYLEQARQQADRHSESQQLRLESDRQLIQIVTIHKAKGLEYPLVFLPFATAARPARSSDLPLPLQSVVQAGTQADEERLAEDLRKLYVALTRASHAQWLGLHEHASLGHSALGYLLGYDPQQPLAVQLPACLPLQQPTLSADLYQPPPSQRLQPVRSSQLQLEQWWIASYSALQYEGAARPALLQGHPDQAQDRAIEATAAELQDEATQQSSQTSGQLLHDFPAGSQWGTFLHSLLEWAAVCPASDHHQQPGFAAAASQDQLRLHQLQQRCQLQGIEPLAADLSTWLKGFLQQSWHLPFADCPAFALQDLPPDRLLVELEFLLPATRVDAVRLDQLVSQYLLPGQPRPAVRPMQLNGLLKGFIDLVFEHHGRYYLLDWKSNRLGDTDADYDPPALQAALLKKRYDLQYVLYLLALHRLLQQRLPDYDYDRHIGGAIYVFLRGSQNQNGQGLYCDRPSRQLIETLDQWFTVGSSPLQPEVNG